MYRDGQLRDISEVSEVGVTIIQQSRYLGPFTRPLSSSPSVDHVLTMEIKTTRGAMSVVFQSQRSGKGVSFSLSV